MTAITLSRARHGLLVDSLADRAEPVARSERFVVYALDPNWPTGGGAPALEDIVLVHDFARREIDNNIGRFVAEELLPLLTASGSLGRSNAGEQEVFERFVGDIVRSMDGNEDCAWRLFYDNTLAALHWAGQGPGETNGTSPAPQDFIADFAAIYRRVADLVTETAPDTVLDVATCFGFLPMLLASDAWGNGTGSRRPRRIVGCDLNPALIALAEGVARQRRLTDTRFVRADILDADRAPDLAPPYDVVTAIHLLEHLEPMQTAPAMDALWSMTGRRLIIAVPVEEVPDARFGHRRVFDQDSLGALGRRTDGFCHGFDHHGAWLVIDRIQQDGLDARGLA